MLSVKPPFQGVSVFTSSVTGRNKAVLSHTERIKFILDAKKIPFVLYDIVEYPEYKEYFLEQYGTTKTMKFPQVYYGDKYFGGLDEVENANEEGIINDRLTYPLTPGQSATRRGEFIFSRVKESAVMITLVESGPTNYKFKVSVWYDAPVDMSLASVYIKGESEGRFSYLDQSDPARGSRTRFNTVFELPVQPEPTIIRVNLYRTRDGTVRVEDLLTRVEFSTAILPNEPRDILIPFTYNAYVPADSLAAPDAQRKPGEHIKLLEAHVIENKEPSFMRRLEPTAPVWADEKVVKRSKEDKKSNNPDEPAALSVDVGSGDEGENGGAEQQDDADNADAAAAPVSPGVARRASVKGDYVLERVEKFEDITEKIAEGKYFQKEDGPPEDLLNVLQKKVEEETELQRKRREADEAYEREMLARGIIPEEVQERIKAASQANTPTNEEFKKGDLDFGFVKGHREKILEQDKKAWEAYEREREIKEEYARKEREWREEQERLLQEEADRVRKEEEDERKKAEEDEARARSAVIPAAELSARGQANATHAVLLSPHDPKDITAEVVENPITAPVPPLISVTDPSRNFLNQPFIIRVKRAPSQEEKNKMKVDEEQRARAGAGDAETWDDALVDGGDLVDEEEDAGAAKDEKAPVPETARSVVSQQARDAMEPSDAKVAGGKSRYEFDEERNGVHFVQAADRQAVEGCIVS